MKNNIVALTGKKHYKTDISFENHTVIADEPFDLGGEDLGPNSGAILNMALGSCTSITLRMYADRKGWEVDDVKVSVEFERNGNITKIKRLVEVTGNLDEQQKRRMMQIANMCPVHKILSNPIEIHTELIE